jgi:hypothetical protein
MKPTNLEECMIALDLALSLDDQNYFISLKEDELVRHHHDLGRWIRNNWDLWAGGELSNALKAMGFTHPDDMSGSIIREWWARKNNKPSLIENEIKSYAIYWAKANKEHT